MNKTNKQTNGQTKRDGQLKILEYKGLTSGEQICRKGNPF